MKNMVKRIALGFAAGFLFVSGASAYNMEIPNRFLEFGVDMDFGFSNNYFAAKDILKEEWIFDFSEMAGELGEDGLRFDGNLNASGFVNLNLTNGISVKAKTGYESYGSGNISRELFDFIGNGNSLNETLSFDGNMSMDMFAYTSADVNFDIGGFRVGAGIGCFLPLMHVETTKIDAYFVNGPDGSIVTKAFMGLKANSCFNMQPFIDGDYDVSKISNSGDATVGIDLSGSVEREVFKSLTARGYMRLPVIPGSLKDVAYGVYEMNYTASSVISMVEDGASNLSFEEGDKLYGTETYWISRPFHMGAEIAWRPFGQYVTFNALLGFGVKYPWTEEAKGFVEYNFGVNAALFNMLGMSLSSSYLNEVFIHQVGMMLNFRVFEIDIGVSSQGANFSKSCAGSGIGAFAAVKVGW